MFRDRRLTLRKFTLRNGNMEWHPPRYASSPLYLYSCESSTRTHSLFSEYIVYISGKTFGFQSEHIYYIYLGIFPYLAILW